MAPIKNVVLVFAMEAEAKPLIEHLGLKQDEPRAIPAPAPCVTYSGAFNGETVRVVWTGRDAEHGVDLVGTVPAALATYLALSAWPDTDLVISAGTAGGFKAKGAAIGDVFVSTTKMHHDRRIPLPGFDKFGLGFVPSAPTPRMQAALGLKPGVVTSGDSLDYTDRCMAIMLEHGAAVKEMEAGSIAWAAGLHGKPVLCIKAITDIVDGDRATHEEFLENLHSAAAALQGMLPRVLEFVNGKTLEQL
ncbi:hypothetical protein Rsub_04213 [Raphidocelis subcapitata]|uniref:Nucleoside phosphorylase domain-containing protein n=1 Tax=Raphidocelis subcapitata TaxID=307507 RepID=A0A2V0P0V1_9CHLO|nr:hypothetical protein Rsub_04213 [Raphidocelis subcapitata]|eukprot:GBF91473.1 hypothetical protein Rsub_04213 [Raphidocelis subcapitata]